MLYNAPLLHVMTVPVVEESVQLVVDLANKTAIHLDDVSSIEDVRDLDIPLGLHG